MGAQTRWRGKRDVSGGHGGEHRHAHLAPEAGVAQVQALSSETGSAAQQVMMASSELSTQSENVRREVEDFLAAIRAA